MIRVVCAQNKIAYFISLAQRFSISLCLPIPVLFGSMHMSAAAVAFSLYTLTIQIEQLSMTCMRIFQLENAYCIMMAAAAAAAMALILFALYRCKFAINLLFICFACARKRTRARVFMFVFKCIKYGLENGWNCGKNRVE